MSRETDGNPAPTPGWDRGAVFFANLPSLFFGNDEAVAILRRRVGRLETYGGRLVPILDLLFRKGPNLLVLERGPTGPLLDYFGGELGLALPDVLTVPAGFFAGGEESGGKACGSITEVLEAIESHPAGWIDGFVTDEGIARIAVKAGKQTISSVEGSRRGNNKFLLHRFLEERGLPVFDTRCVSGPAQAPAALRALRAAGYRFAVAKAAVGASGIGMIKLDLEQSAADPGASGNPLPDYLFHAGPCLVQGWLDASVPGVRTLGSPSAQLFLGEEDVSIYDLTEQILSGESIHEGNVAPPPCLVGDASLRRELRDQALAAGGWLRDQGYRGTASVDFLVVEQRGERTVFACEVNARVTGATYPSLLAHRFHPGGAWQMRNAMLSRATPAAEVLKTLRAERLLFLPGGETGVIPINFYQDAAGAVGKMQVLALGGSVSETDAAFRKLERASALKCRYDRD